MMAVTTETGSQQWNKILLCSTEYIYIYIYIIVVFQTQQYVLYQNENTGSCRNTWRFGNTAVSGTVGVGNLSLSALPARLKAFQLPWSPGL